MLAILPSAKANTLHIMKAESPGPSTEKFVPKIGQVAKILYAIYVIMTFVEMALLVAGGMPPFDALIHSFGTASTGGFSIKNASIAAYGSLYVEIVVAVFMILFGVNLTLYHMILRRKFKLAIRDEELRFYFITIVLSILLIAINTTGSIYQSFGESLRYSSFQVGSIITTTGFFTTDFNIWPVFSRFILILLMFLGSMAGSTSGGIKQVRILLLFKMVRREFGRLIHPRSVKSVTLNGRVVEEETLNGIVIFFFLYMAIYAVAVAIVTLDGIDLISSSTAVLSAISNVGPGIGIMGSGGYYGNFSHLSSLVLSFCMLLGRLEIYPLLLLCTPSLWKRVNI
jgi:trk system potassium uptake protein TrkH